MCDCTRWSGKTAHRRATLLTRLVLPPTPCETRLISTPRPRGGIKDATGLPEFVDCWRALPHPGPHSLNPARIPGWPAPEAVALPELDGSNRASVLCRLAAGSKDAKRRIEGRESTKGNIRIANFAPNRCARRPAPRLEIAAGAPGRETRRCFTENQPGGNDSVTRP